MTTKVTKVWDLVLRQELNAPAFLSRTVQQTLLVTEAPPGSKSVNVENVTNQTLIYDELGKTTAQQVWNTALVVTTAAFPLTVPGATSVIEQALIKEHGDPSLVTQVHPQALLLVEGPIVRTDLNQVNQLALTADLSRGTLYANDIDQNVLLQTEVPTRDPYRAKTTTVMAASNNAYVHPSQNVAPHRLKNTYTFVGLSVSYPERSVSPIRVPSAVNQLAVKTPQVPLNTIISNTRVPAAYGSVAHKFSLPNPLSIKSQNHANQLLKGIAQKTGFTDPTALISIRHTQQITVSQGHAASYKPTSEIQSKSKASSLYALSANRTTYQVPPQSQTAVNGVKTEIAAPKTSFLDPLDPRLASQIHWNAAKFESASATTLDDPYGIFSTETAMTVDARIGVVADYVSPNLPRSPKVVNSFKVGTATPTTFGNPDGIMPGGRQYQIGLVHVYGSPFYQILPISSEKTQRVAVETASPHTFRNPIFVSPTIHIHQSKMEVAVNAIYGDPTAAKPKRRVSSSVTVGVPA